jgi:hypothetical protein
VHHFQRRAIAKCYDRPRTRLADYFFTISDQPLFPEEVTLCAINKLFIIPMPVVMMQFPPAECNVTYDADQQFTIIGNGYESCCLFKILGTKYFWRSPGCTKRRIVSCVTKSQSYITARYDAADACTAKNIYIKLDISRRISYNKKLNRLDTSILVTHIPIHTAVIQWKPFLGFLPCGILVIGILVGYSVFRYRYIFSLRADGTQRRCRFSLCGECYSRDSTIELLDGNVRIRLLPPMDMVLQVSTVMWNGSKFFADAVAVGGLTVQLAFSAPKRLLKHLDGEGESLRIVGVSNEDLRPLTTSSAPMVRQDSQAIVEIPREYPQLPSTDADVVITTTSSNKVVVVATD